MAYIREDVGKGATNLPSDVKIIQWMLIRAQLNYENVFGQCWNILENGIADDATVSAIEALIRYVKRVSPDSTDSIQVIGQTLSNEAFKKMPILFKDSVIFPNDVYYKYLLKCTLAPICLNPDRTRIAFNTDPLVIQALAGKIDFESFRKSVVLKDVMDCDESLKTKQNGNKYYTIDKGIILEADAIAVLNKIGPLYFKEVGKKFNVNSGTRDSHRQAEAMYQVYHYKDKRLSLYRNRKIANELIAIMRKGKPKSITVKEMAQLLQKYLDEKNIVMSSHQRAGAIDIAINGDVATGVPRITAKERMIMLRIAKKVTGFPAILEKSPPHIHIKFK